MIAALFLACVAQAAPEPAQFEPSTPLEIAIAAHQGVARAERELTFFERYAAAPEDARARARAVLERLRPPGAPAHAPSSMFAVAKALRALAPEAAPAAAPEASAPAAGPGRRERERLEELVDALDVQPVPGIFDASATTGGRAIGAVVAPLYPPPERLQVTLSLVWTRPDGSPLLAYRGLAKPAVFDPAGFAVELAAPAGGGDWELAIEVEREGILARGLPVDVQFVARLHERANRQFSPWPDPLDVRAPVARWLALLEQRGWRTLLCARAEDLLARLEGGDGAARGFPWRSVFLGTGGEPEWIWRVDSCGPTGPTRSTGPTGSPGSPASAPDLPPRATGTLLVLCPRAEPVEAVLTRREWSDFAGWRVLSARLPRGGSEGTIPAFFAGVHAALAAAGESGPLVCVARGETQGQLAMAFHGSATRPYAAEILPLASAPEDPKLLAGKVPRVVLAPGGAADAGAARQGAATWWLDAQGEPLIAEYELPGRVASALSLLRESLASAALPITPGAAAQDGK